MVRVQQLSLSRAPLPRVLTPNNERLAQVAAALLHRLEHLPVFGIDLASLVADPISRVRTHFAARHHRYCCSIWRPDACIAQTLEEACLRVAAEARAHAPCILYIPRIALWYGHTSGVLHEALKSVLDDMPPTTPVLLVRLSLSLSLSLSLLLACLQRHSR